MVSPSWSPLHSDDPPVDLPPRRPAVAFGILAGSVTLAAAMVLLVSGQDVGSEQYRAEVVVDEFITEMVEGEWETAYDRFDPSCTDFSSETYRRAFERALNGYRGHRTLPVDPAPVDPDEILLVRGFVDLAPGGDHPYRAELIDAGAAGGPSWVLCGFRIDAP